MKKTIILILLFTQIVFANKLNVIQQISDIPIGKDVVLVFSLKFCPYCLKQEKSIIKRVQPKFPQIAYLKVIKGTKVFQELIQTGNFGEVEYFPTTFILKMDKKHILDVKYPFKGLQHSSNIISILKDKNIMED